MNQKENQELIAFKKNLGNKISAIIKENLTPDDIEKLRKMRDD